MYFWYSPFSAYNFQQNQPDLSLIQHSESVHHHYLPFSFNTTHSMTNDHYFHPAATLYQSLSIPNYSSVGIEQDEEDVPERDQAEKARNQNLEMAFEQQAQNQPQNLKKTLKKSQKKNSKNKVEQIPGRNRVSNVFSAFFKYLLNPRNCRYAKKLSSEIITAKSLKITPGYFIQKLKRKIVNFETYISKPQFFSIYESDGDFGIIFRIMLHDFFNTRGVLHITTAKTRKKVLQENKAYFMKGLRELEELFSSSCQKIQEAKKTSQKFMNNDDNQ